MTLLLTIVPSLLIAYYIYISDKFTEPKGLCVKAFIIGILISFPIGLLNEYFIWSYENPHDYAWLAGITEESVKFLAVLFLAKKHFELDEPMDAIVYGTLVSLGFATLENYQYVYVLYPDAANYTAIWRAFTAIPMHACCGIIMGFHLGLYIFYGSKTDLYKALLLPMIFHALYNFTITAAGIFWGIIVLWFIFSYAMRLHKAVKIVQSLKSEEKEKRFN